MTAAKTLSLVSLGCAKNAVDLQVRVGNLLKEGYRLSPDPDRADTCLVNTCAFIAEAREEAEAEIARALELKRRGRYRRVVVLGCYPERYPERRSLFPGVDGWEGVPGDWVESKTPGMRLTGKAYAYLKIAEGCAHRCAYCAIPSIRGKYRSRPLKAVLKEARALIKTGCRELNVVAQDPMLWREEKVEKRGGGGEQVLTLPDLLWALDRIKGDFWVRVLYSYPSEITEEFVRWMLTAKHAVRYLDVPLQHTEPEILRRMNRAPAIEASRSAAEVLRAVIPGVTLRTTILTGFPGETRRRFERMLADLKRMQFDRMGAFAYSPEKGTKGAGLRGRPSRAEAEARADEVRKLGAAIWREKARRLTGTVEKALVVAPGVARLASQAPDVDGVVILKGACPHAAAVGEFVRVRIVRADGFDFIGKVV